MPAIPPTRTTAATGPQTTMLRLEDVARELKCSLRTVQKLAQSGDLNAVRIGRLVRVRRTDFENFVQGLPS